MNHELGLPQLVCWRRELGGLTADPQSPFWQRELAVDLREAVGGGDPLQATALKLACDRTELRVLFDCQDREAWATLSERDAPLYTEEVVEVFLDPFGDLESYFEIEVNPLNTVLDLVLRRSRSGYLKDFAWTCEGLRTHVENTPRGWAAELSMPFTSMAPEPPKEGAQWRVNFCRIDRPRGAEWELSAWSPPRRPLFHTPERFGVLEFR